MPNMDPPGPPEKPLAILEGVITPILGQLCEETRAQGWESSALAHVMRETDKCLARKSFEQMPMRQQLRAIGQKVIASMLYAEDGR